MKKEARWKALSHDSLAEFRIQCELQQWREGISTCKHNVTIYNEGKVSLLSFSLTHSLLSRRKDGHLYIKSKGCPAHSEVSTHSFLVMWLCQQS